MKISDDYKAKYRLWARNLKVVPPGDPVRIPHFKSKRFKSHEEMNRWKEEMIKQLARTRNERVD